MDRIGLTDVSGQRAILPDATPFYDFFNSSSGHVVVASVAGMLGSVVSILLRLGEFETTKGRSQMFLTLTGATLPFVGGMFGVFVAALLSSEIVNVNFGETGHNGMNIWFFLVIGFLSGFSERFSRGFLKIAEDKLGGGGPVDQSINLVAQAVAPVSQGGSRSSSEDQQSLAH